MPAGSHKDAFKAHQKVKRIFNKDGSNRLPKLAADILLDFVKNQRQINRDNILESIPTDGEAYETPLVHEALLAVDSLCGKCDESHDDACFVNQVRRVLIATATGVDLGVGFDGKSTLDELMVKAKAMGGAARETKALVPDKAAPCSGGSCVNGCGSAAVAVAGSANPAPGIEEAASSEGERLRQQVEELHEREVFRGTLIDEIVSTIASVTGGNYSSEMPVHEDEQLGKLATAFNLMLDNVKQTMSRLDELVQERSAELRRIMDRVDKGILTVDTELRIGPEYSAHSLKLFGVNELRGRSLLEILGLVGRRSGEGDQVREFASLYFSQLLPPEDLAPLNPLTEYELAQLRETGPEIRRWLSFRFFPLPEASGKVGRLLVEVTDISPQKLLAAEVDLAHARNAQISAIASDQDLFREFVSETRTILAQVEEALPAFAGHDAREAANRLFRGIHTIKGTAAAFKLKQLVEATGQLETFLSPLRQCESASPETVETVKAGLLGVREAFCGVLELARPLLGHDLEEDAGASLRVPVAELETLLREAEPILAGAGLAGNQALERICRMLMIPARKAFSRSVKALPGLAERLGKMIRLEFSGEDTPVPVRAASLLDAGLMHILRNACDHGLEEPDERDRAGKAEMGTIRLECFGDHRGLVVRVRDDGRGIDAGKVRLAALAKGVISPEEADVLSTEETYRLLARPGFSTRDEATDVSGRGVGLDAVVAAVESDLGGDLRIESALGKGSVFELRIPLS